jgi:hypothetical protein
MKVKILNFDFKFKLLKTIRKFDTPLFCFQLEEPCGFTMMEIEDRGNKRAHEKKNTFDKCNMSVVPASAYSGAARWLHWVVAFPAIG